MPVMFTATGNIPPATGINFTAPTLVGFLTQYVWKRYRTVQWAKYNYVLSAALAGATAISTVFLFFFYPSISKRAEPTISEREMVG